MKILVDMNLSPQWVKTLTDAGFTALHWSTAGLATAPDQEIMAYAREREFIVLTHDLDFSAILAATHGEKPSVIQLRSTDIRPEILGQQVIASLQHLSADLNNGALLTITATKSRLRILPLHLRD